MADLRYPPLVTLERNNAGELFLGCTEFNQGNHHAVRSFVIARRPPDTVESVFRRQCDDIVRLMGDNVQYEDQTPEAST